VPLIYTTRQNMTLISFTKVEIWRKKRSSRRHSSDVTCAPTT